MVELITGAFVATIGQEMWLLVRDTVSNALGDRLDDRWESQELGRQVQTAVQGGLRALIAEIDDELEDQEVGAESRQLAADGVRRLLDQARVRGALAGPFHSSTAEVSGEFLERAWGEVTAGDSHLPGGFSWSRVAKRYSRSAHRLADECPALREARDTQNLRGTREAVEQLAAAQPVQPGFDFVEYRAAMRRQYGRLKLEELDPSTHDIQPLMLTGMFIPQSARECTEFVPRLFELPKEVQKRLREQSELGPGWTEEEMERCRRVYLEQSSASVLEIVEWRDCSRMVLLGDPGSGKSTLLQYLVLRWAEATPRQAKASPLPLLIELRQYARARTRGCFRIPRVPSPEPRCPLAAWAARCGCLAAAA